MAKDKIAVKTYKYFSTLEGNQHIASEYALRIINRIIRAFSIKSVLELGLGIGSISYAVLHNSNKYIADILYTGTESNIFCLKVLPINLKNYYPKIDLYPTLKEIPENVDFDLIIIDGKEEMLESVKKWITKHGIILIEGDRTPQLEIIRKAFPKCRYTRAISNYKNPVYGPFPTSDWCGGIQIIFINPTLKQKVYYLSVKMATSIKYKLRK